MCSFVTIEKISIDINKVFKATEDPHKRILLLNILAEKLITQIEIKFEFEKQKEKKYIEFNQIRFSVFESTILK